MVRPNDKTVLLLLQILVDQFTHKGIKPIDKYIKQRLNKSSVFHGARLSSLKTNPYMRECLIRLYAVNPRALIALLKEFTQWNPMTGAKLKVSEEIQSIEAIFGPDVSDEDQKKRLLDLSGKFTRGPKTAAFFATILSHTLLAEEAPLEKLNFLGSFMHLVCDRIASEENYRSVIDLIPLEEEYKERLVHKDIYLDELEKLARSEQTDEQPDDEAADEATKDEAAGNKTETDAHKDEAVGKSKEQRHPEKKSERKPAKPADPEGNSGAQKGVSLEKNAPKEDAGDLEADEPPVLTHVIAPCVAHHYDPVEAPRVFPGSVRVEKHKAPLKGRRRFLGHLRPINNWLNFCINAEEVDGVFYNVDPAEMRSLFPKYGAFNVRSVSSPRLPLKECAFYVADISKAEDMLENMDMTTLSMRDDYQFFANYDTLKREQRIAPSAEFGLHPIVHPAPGSGRPDFDKAIRVTFVKDLEEEHPGYKDAPVLLAYDGLLLGPVMLRRDAAGHPTVNFPTGATMGLIDGFAPKPNRSIQMLSITVDSRNTEEPGWHHEFEIVLAATADLVPVRYDAMSAETMVKKLLGTTSGDRASRERLLEVARTDGDSNYVFTEDKDVRESRYARILNLISNDGENQRFIEDVAHISLEHLKNEDLEESRLFTEIAKRVVADPELSTRLEGNRILASQKRDLANEVQNLMEEKARVEEEQKELSLKFKNDVQARYKQLTARNESLARSVSQRRQELDVINKYAELKSECTLLEERLTAQREEKAAIEKEVRDLGENLRKSVTQYRKYAFDGMLANQFLEAASLWNQEDGEKKEAERFRAVMAVKEGHLRGNDLKERLLNGLAEWRGYEKNEFLNLFICVTQNFLTVFSGAPGLGKTSICNLMGHMMGLNLVGERLASPELFEDPMDANRYLPISVERGWTGKRDFIGYWNPLTKTFESADERRYRAFRQLDAEARAGVEKLPFLMLLDEANLSPMEYYWADFMNVCDRRDEYSAITLGDKQQYRIPDTLRFVATINNDHTTEMLSPRLIDRAMVVTLPEFDWNGIGTDSRTNSEGQANPDEIVSWAAMKELFGAREISRDRSIINETLTDVVGHMSSGGFNMSMRVHRACEGYISAAMDLFEEDRPGTATVAAIDRAVAQKILPHIVGNGEAFEKWLVEFSSLLESYGLMKCKAEVDRILTTGNAQMKYYRFF